MSNHNHHYRDPHLSTQQAAGCTLLVQVGPASLSYAVIGSNKLLLLEENVSLNELTHPMDEHQLLHSSYKQCVVILPQTGFTFIPTSLYRPDHVADFARFLDVKADEKVFSQSLDTENQVIFKTDKAIADTVAGKFGSENIVFSALGWIKVTAAAHPTNHDLYINTSSDNIELLYFKDSKLRFYNTFEFKTTDELVYFSMFVSGELNLQPEDTNLILSGDISEENGIRLAEFFGKVVMNSLHPVEVPDTIPAHQILTLTALCGSSEAH